MSVASDSDYNFWTGDDQYHELARTYERNIEYTHPESVTSKRMCVCLDYCSYCGWAATSVNYYRYDGPDVTNINK